MVQLNPQQGNNTLNTPGILLIDEIERYLHPNHQQRILLALQKTFPNLQIICTTLDSHIIAMVPKESIRVLSKEGTFGIT